jgi:hypothetical protein
MPALIRPYIDPEQGLKQNFSQNLEINPKKDLEYESIDAIERSSEQSVRNSKFISEKELDHDSTHSSKYSPNLTLAPISQSPITWPSIRFQSPTVQEVGSLFELSRKKDPSHTYKRMRAKTWHNGVD